MFIPKLIFWQDTEPVQSNLQQKNTRRETDRQTDRQEGGHTDRWANGQTIDRQTNRSVMWTDRK